MKRSFMDKLGMKMTECFKPGRSSVDFVRVIAVVAFALSFCSGVLGAQTTVYLDLTKAANTGFADPLAGDGKGGWSDQGPDNDFAGFDVRQTNFGGIPFRIIDPEKNSGKAIITFRDAHINGGVDRALISCPTGTSARYLYLLHSSTWFSGKENEVFGTITVTYTDSTVRIIEVISKRDVSDWWSPPTLPNGAVVVSKQNGSATVGCFLSRFAVGKKDGESAEMDSLEFEPKQKGIWIVIGVTLSETGWDLPKVQKFVARENAEWKPVQMGEGRVKAGTALDFSKLLGEGSAGKYGRVIIHSSGGFAFEKQPEQQVRFFGCSIAPGFLEKMSDDEIDAYAEAIRLQGYNMVRTHFLDGALTDGSPEDLEFKPGMLDRFDFFVAALKKRGIYIYLDVMTSWKGFLKVGTWTKEGTDADLKTRIYVEDEVKQHWKTGVGQLLSHPNPYTQTRLADDPIVAILLFYNEQNLNLFGTVPGLLTDPWRKYIANKYTTIEKVRAAWVNRGNGKPLLVDSVTLETIPTANGSTFWEQNQRGVDWHMFVTSIETDLVRWYTKEIRAMGYAGLTTWSDWLQNYREAVPRNEVDVISQHGYHGTSGYDNAGEKMSQASSVAEENSWWRSMASCRFLNRPFAIPEYGQTYWNRYRYEEGIVVGGYCALQDYGMIGPHAEPVRQGNQPRIIRPYAVQHDPIGRASQVVAGALFLRRDVDAAIHSVALSITPQTIFMPENAAGAMPREQSRLALVTRLGITCTGSNPPKSVVPFKPDATFGISGAARVVATAWGANIVDGADGKFSAATFLSALKEKGIIPAENRTDPKNGIFESENGQLLLEAHKPMMTLRTARAEGVASILYSKPICIDALTIFSSSKPAQVVALSVDGKSLAASERILIVYSTDALNTGATFDSEDRTVIREKGELPVLVQCGTFNVSLKNRQAAGFKAWALGFDGVRREELVARNGGDTIGLTVDTATLRDGPTVFFELALK